MRLHVPKQPLHRDERHDPRHHEADREGVPVFRTAVVPLLEELVPGGREHDRDADQKRELRGRGARRQPGQHRREDRGRRTGRARKHSRDDLSQSHPHHDTPGHGLQLRLAGDQALDDQDRNAADPHRNGDRQHFLGELDSRAGRPERQHQGDEH